MIKAVLFDLDGTLLDRAGSLKLFIDQQYNRFTDYFQHLTKTQYTKRFIELDHFGYTWKDEVYQKIIKEYKIEGITWEELLEDYLFQFKYHCVPFANLIPMLEELKKDQLILGIISNGKGQFQMDNIQALKIKDFFSCILISEWEGLKKPDPEIFYRALKKLDITASECIYVGDHPINDIKAAQSLGITGIWKRNDQWQGAQANFIIDDLKEIPDIIKKRKQPINVT